MSDKQIEVRIKELGDHIDDSMSIVHGTLYGLLQEMGQIDHPDAVEFLMGDGSMDHFFRRDVDEYKVILYSFMNYLRRGKLPEEVLQRIAYKLVEISEVRGEEYGNFRQEGAKIAIETLQAERNSLIARVLKES